MASAMCFLFSFADYGAYEPDPREARAGQRLLFRRKPQKQSRGLTRQRQTYRALATKGFAVLFLPHAAKRHLHDLSPFTTHRIK
jgi:hypothetical protein